MNDQNKKTRKLQKHVFHFLPLLFFLAIALGSCADDSIDGGDVNTDIDNNLNNEKVTLSIAFDNSASSLRSSENPNITNESAIYSLDVLVFKVGDNLLDVHSSMPRVVDATNATGVSYKKRYIQINTINDIKVTRGLRDIFVVANAPHEYFKGVKNKADFFAKQEILSNQTAYYIDSIDTVINSSTNPNSGKPGPDLETNLTMYNSIKNVNFATTAKHYYLGNIPISGSDKEALNSGRSFEVERLVARAAIERITFQLPYRLTFETTPVAFDYELDSVFLLNAKSLSRISVDVNSPAGGFVHGNVYCKDSLRGLLQDSLKFVVGDYAKYVAENIVPNPDGNYDIATKDSIISNTPLWFYTFENRDGVNPTYFVISVNFYFKDTSGSIKKRVAYYPILINKGVISRNTQYKFRATIKGLGHYKSDIMLPRQKSVSMLNDVNSFMEVEEVSGANLFPWTGTQYK